MKLILFLFFSANIFLWAQDSSESLAFKNKNPFKRKTVFYQPDLSYRIWQQFNLVREANSGNSLAQHELGLRYLLGEDQPADTQKAVFWIRKAALQNLPAAAFNYGILLFNGWGAEWNPFEAYKNFLIAAKDTMPQALYIVGMLHTDNLAVQKDWGKAYYYVKRSAEKGYQPAIDVLPEIRKQLPPSFDTSGKMTSYLANQTDNSSPGLLFLDFDKPSPSLSSAADDTVLFTDLLLTGNKEFEEKIIKKNGKAEINFTVKDLPLLKSAAAWGSPEALTLLGRFYEKGIHAEKDYITAVSYYIRASKLDSYRAKLLLLEMIKDEESFKELTDAALNKNPAAMFAWYGLTDFGIDKSITEKDAIDLLISSSEAGYLPARSELGLLYYTGRYVSKDTARALTLWKAASDLGFKEAGIRVNAAEFYMQHQKNLSLSMITEANEQGSLFAQVTLGVINEQKGHKTEAVNLYRSAARRGNVFAFEQLKRLYDEIRPPEKQFTIE